MNLHFISLALLSLKLSLTSGHNFLRQPGRSMSNSANATRDDLVIANFSSEMLLAQNQSAPCVQLYEWTLSEDAMVINDKQYYGFNMSSSIGTFTLPMYTNIDLTGNPVARLRGNLITDPTGGFTASAAIHFYDVAAFVAVSLSYTYEPALAEDFVYGFTVGGTGAFKDYHADVKSVVVAMEPKFIVEWTFCNEM
ncbi:expressed unknown protein [Seminavis robusta]|uniref:Uncharacterized protein n=1 Tax=Seminavis robusta TaxID=568900 RepID=A0A9N8HMZ2_9STRA|nr:expressed unknown protein [Seminavis robusta]|eukprot:Sro783_g201910.1 n/a (195) ;mRNA; f:31519-32103